MTENEAKTNLELVTNKWESAEEMFSDSMDIIIDQEFVDTLYIAIKALGELPQYRAIGTVEELETASKYLRLVKMCGTVGRVIEECAEYEEIGTPEECRAAVEQQIPKRPTLCKSDEQTTRYTADYRCPKCNGMFTGTGIANYCYHCGQRLDWEELT